MRMQTIGALAVVLLTATTGIHAQAPSPSSGARQNPPAQQRVSVRRRRWIRRVRSVCTSAPIRRTTRRATTSSATSTARRTRRRYAEVTKGVVASKKVTYRSRIGDLDIPAYVFEPLEKRGPKGHAAMVWVHGGVHGDWDEHDAAVRERGRAARLRDHHARLSWQHRLRRGASTTRSTTAARRSTT